MVGGVGGAGGGNLPNILKCQKGKLNLFHGLEEGEGFGPYSLKLQQGFRSTYLERENNNTWLPLTTSSL